VWSESWPGIVRWPDEKVCNIWDLFQPRAFLSKPAV
jgi:hypothetical protein